MTETLRRGAGSVPAPRSAPTPEPAPAHLDDWSQPTPESRRLSELEQLRIDLAAGR